MEIDGNSLLFIIIILFLFFSSPGGDGVSSQYEFNQLQKLREQVSKEYKSFEEMTYNSNFKDITGLKLSYLDIKNSPEINATYPLPDKHYDSWEPTEKYMLLPDSLIKIIDEEVWYNSNANSNNIFPPNISSTVLGKVNLISNNEYLLNPMPIPRFYEPSTDFSNTVPPEGELYLRDFLPRNKDLNVTFTQGDLTIEISHLNKVASEINYSKKKEFNTQSDKWKLLNLRITFHDSSENQKHSINTLAVYDITRGRILSISQSAKFRSIFAFPHYFNFKADPSDKVFNEVKQLINDYVTTSNYVETLTMSNIQEWYDESHSKCEFMTFLQLEPWNQYTKDQIKMIDDELKWPLGRPANLSSLPPISIKSGLLFSPDCGLHLQLENVKGERYELQVRSIRVQLMFGVLLFVSQIYLLLLQMKYTNTPSSINKISFYTLSMINLVDGSLATMYFIAASVLPELYLPLVISAFICFILASIFETRYLISVYSSQINEQSVGILTLLRGNLSENNEQRQTIIPDDASISSSLYGRFFFSLITFTFLILSSTAWSKQFRMVFEYVTIFALNSYWIPQIFRNAIKGSPPRGSRRNLNSSLRRQYKNPFLWKFVIGTTLIRVLPVVYVFTYPSNIFRHHKDTFFAVLLCCWLGFQLLVLYSQEIFGSRWFLPKLVIPEGYSYHKAMSLQNLLEHGASSDHTVDCAICMSEVPVYVDDVPTTHKVDLDSFMITPCNHVFHTQCLENWMGYKLQCPVCRAPLPPL
ncbi:hypothetical protein Kpol_1002p7 [Vanderwaltozyma polyspora DSM 70294]|uniref:RING-type E3 ubiquitin transferase n=1 Tax=Vanderwaltozyma polyspora (strain ATCC 22028 / DSM 70294 / BCRC 21397 / CBS 2163 / NBRC 10782 / NRRL Y-8283 / UCD 57-17) TaxID=436907 RepID=A7TE40_VANPO|nr:uncharacterized protein Kpol_1002p7 [Vanderwaltozyma polyspora DSM 70294]EDO19362.1 hypothetical protein Kpol_1002p7 [Vanderwaltozyma polyspora DSM 70294]